MENPLKIPPRNVPTNMCAIAMGVKNASGQPSGGGRFYLVSPETTNLGMRGRRPPVADFAQFNRQHHEYLDIVRNREYQVFLASKRRVDPAFTATFEQWDRTNQLDDSSRKAMQESYDSRRRTLRGIIDHAEFPKWYHGGQRLHAVAKEIGPPDGRRPFCTGNGIDAKRWNSTRGEYVELKGQCGSTCRWFGKECKRDVTVMFTLRWNPWDCERCKGVRLASSVCPDCNGAGTICYPSWRTELSTSGVRSSDFWWLTFIEIDQQWRTLGWYDKVGELDWFGLSIAIRLDMRPGTGKDNAPGSLVPMLRIAPDFASGATVRDWFAAKASGDDALLRQVIGADAPTRGDESVLDYKERVGRLSTNHDR